MSTFKAMIKSALETQKPDEITVLHLDECTNSKVSDIPETLVNLRVLTMIDSKLTSLEGFPTLPNLYKLDLSDNKIRGGLENICKCKDIEKLYLNSNIIKVVEDLKPLEKLEDLRYLDLNLCEIANNENYRQEIWKVLPNIQYISSFNENNEQYDDSTDEDDDEESDNEVDDSVNDEEEESEEEMTLKDLLDDKKIANAEFDQSYEPKEDEDDDDLEDDDDEDTSELKNEVDLLSPAGKIAGTKRKVNNEVDRKCDNGNGKTLKLDEPAEKKSKL